MEKETAMSRESKKLMASGAGGTVDDGNGEIETTFDRMAAGIKRVAKLFKRGSSEHKVSFVAHA